MDRIALVIGNSKYQNGNALTNPENDANDIERVLSKLSFDVTKVIDANLIAIRQLILSYKHWMKTLLDYYSMQDMVCKLTGKITLFLLILHQEIRARPLYRVIA